jgi:3-hydroxy acid dehydrogenase/malonic semialdehyde reductase
MIDPATMTVFITGASSGFGAATARQFAERGARVIASARRVDRVLGIRDLLPVLFKDNLLAVELDVRDKNAVDQTIESLPEGFDKIDVLVNNAGLALGMGPAHTADMDDWEGMIDTNIKGLMYCTRAILPGMVERDRGHVINLGSVAGSYPYPGGNIYGASKAFVHQFSLNLRADLIGHQVRVTSVEPGMAETEFTEVRLKGDAAKAKTVYQGMQPATADDIADVIRYVATTPAHVNINRIEIMPVQQAFQAFAVHREA